MQENIISQSAEAGENLINQNNKMEENLISQDNYFQNITQLITDQDHLKDGYKIPKTNISVTDFLNGSCIQPISTETLIGSLIDQQIPIPSNYYEGDLFNHSIDSISCENPRLLNSCSFDKEWENQIISQISNQPNAHDAMVKKPFEIVEEIGQSKLVVKRRKNNSFDRPGFSSATFANTRFGYYPDQYASIKYNPNDIDNVNQNRNYVTKVIDTQSNQKQNQAQQQQEQEQQQQQIQQQTQKHEKNQNNNSNTEENHNKSFGKYGKMNRASKFNQFNKQIIYQNKKIEDLIQVIENQSKEINNLNQQIKQLLELRSSSIGTLGDIFWKWLTWLRWKS